METIEYLYQVMMIESSDATIVSRFWISEYCPLSWPVESVVYGGLSAWLTLFNLGPRPFPIWPLGKAKCSSTTVPA